MNARTLAKYEDGTIEPPPQRLVDIGRACGVPARFLRGGFEPGDDLGNEDPLSELVGQVRELSVRLSRMEAQLKAILADRP
jgi:hypothetical protein